MGRYIKIMLFCVLVLSFNINNVFGFVTTHKEKSKNNSKEKILQQRQSKEERKSKGQRGTKAKNKGERESIQKAIRKIKNISKDTSLHISVSNAEIFSEIIMEKELDNKGIFGECAIFTNPQSLANLGLNFEDKNGWIDTTKQQYYTSLAQNSALIEKVTDEKTALRFKKYVKCIAEYSYIIKDATQEMLNDFSDTNLLNLNEIETVAEAALERSLQKLKDKKTKLYKRIRLIKIILERRKCIFFGDLNKIKCGNMLLTFKNATPELYFSGVKVFDEKNIGGIEAKFDVAKNFSLQKAWELAKNTEKYKDISKRIEKYCEKLESAGKSYEATKLKKMTINLMMANKNDIDVMRVLQIPQ